MAETITTPKVLATSPADTRISIEGNIGLSELAWCGKLNLRGDLNNPQFVERVESTLGMTLPNKAHSCTANDTSTLYWLGPDEWLLHCPIATTERVRANLKASLSGIHSTVVDVSDYYTVLRLDGADSSTLLAKACPLDLHPQVFVEGACTQTRFGHASILLHKISSTPTYDIQVRWSFTEYVWDYLVSGMRTL